ncbi:MAG: hypothetical protein K6C94_03685 [Candidatus Gastranaerophilales bacterium]|nr:hypothetical protein [Candidatus Gastranaerophilales bacterium]
MKKKLLTALMLSAAVAGTQAYAEPSALEQALNDTSVSKFIMPSDQSISADLPLNTTRYFEINNLQDITTAHYFKIIGNGHSGFKGDGVGYTVNHLKGITGFHTTGNGGAFNLTNDASLVALSSLFNAGKEPLMTTITDNYASGKGGAIYSDINWGGGVYLANTNIKNNTSGDKGGGLYLDYGINKIISLPGSDVDIVDNLAYINGSVVNNDIYLYTVRNNNDVRGKLRLYADSSALDPSSPNPTGPSGITIGDIRAEGSSDIQIISSNKDTAAGYIDIGCMSLDNGASFSTEKVASNARTETNIMEMFLYRDSIINTVNGYIDDNLGIGWIRLDDSNNKFMVDANLTGNDSSVDPFIIVSGGTAKLAVNIIGADTTKTSGAFRLFTDGSATFADSTTQYGGLKYTFTQSPADKGVFYYTTTKDRSMTLQEALKDITVSEYDMPDVTVADSDLGYMYHYDDEGYFVERTLTINGNHGILITDGNEYSGIRIPTQLYPPEEDFLTPHLIINDLELFQGFTKKASNLESFGTGGALDVEDSVLELHNVTFSDNYAKGAGTAVDNHTFGMGGAVYLITKDGYERVIDPETGHYIQGDHFKSVITDSVFMNNKAISTKGANGGFPGIVDGGGAVFAKGDLDISDSLFTDNAAISAIPEGTAEAGALYVTHNSNEGAINRDVNITNTMFMNNIAGTVEEDGDALYNTSAFGGALLASRVDMNISDSSFIGNIAQAAQLENEYTTVKGTAQGGALYYDYMLSNAPYGININNTTFVMNETKAVDSATLTSDNISQTNSMGGAIALMPAANSFDKILVHITNSDFLSNTSGNGGAIYNKGSYLSIKDSTFKGNYSNHYLLDLENPKWNEDMMGGAIYNGNGAKLMLDGVTFSNNYARKITYDGETPIVDYVKNDITNNASSSGGLYFYGNASTLDGGIEGLGYTHFNLGLDEFGNEDPEATNTTMTIGADTKIVQSLIDVNSGTVIIENADNITARGGLLVGENGAVYIKSGTINIDNKYNREIENSGKIYNAGTIDLTGAQYAKSVTNNEKAVFVNVGTVATGTITNDGEFYNGSNPENPEEIVPEAHVTADITNNANMHNAGLLSGTLNNAGIFINDATVEANIVNAAEGVVVNNNKIFNYITNDGSFANTVGATIDTTGAETTTITNNAGATFINGGDINATKVTNAGTFMHGVNPRNTEETIPEAMLISDFSNSGTAYNAGIITGDVTNTAGEMANDGVIYGDIKNQADGVFVNNGTVSSDIQNTSAEVVNNGTILGNVDNKVFGGFTNNAQATVEGDISNMGTVSNLGTITGNVENHDTVTNMGTIDGDVTNQGEMFTKLNDVTGTITLGGFGSELTLLDENITFNEDNKSKIQGSGSADLNLSGNIVSDATIDYTGRVYLTSGATLTKGAGDAFQDSASKIGVKNGNTATIKMLDGSSDTLNYGNKLDVSGDSTLNLEIDWNDSLTADDTFVNGDILITKLDMTGVEDGASISVINGSAKSKAAIQDIELITSKGDANSVSYNAATGQITGVRTTLTNVLTSSETAGDENAYYNYAMDSNEAGNPATDIVGNITISGNGNAIVNSGLTVGSGTKDGNLTLKDTSVSNVTTMAGNTGAITVNENSNLTIQAENHDVVISGTNGANTNAIFYDNAGGTASTVTLDTSNGHTLTINDDIRSNNANNQLIFNNGTIQLNGVLDPLIAVNTGAYVIRGGVDELISWQLFGGTLKYLNDNYLNNPAKLNAVDFNGGSLDLMNGAATNINLSALNVNGNSNIFVDVDAANQTMDTLTAPAITAVANLNVAGMNIFGTPTANTFTTDFVSAALGNAALIGHVTSTVSTVNTGIYKYLVNYVDDGTKGYFTYNVNQGSNPYVSYDASVFTSSVAAQGALIAQLNNYETAFGNLDQTMLMTQEQRKALRQQNSYAAADEKTPTVYSPLMTQNETRGIWFRPYTSFETVQLENGPDVNNISYGMLVGGDTDVMELGDSGWESQVSVYAGYNGSHQTFDGNGIYQNGGVAGVTGALYKGNFFTALTGNVGAHVANISTLYGRADMTMLASGIASKTGYNWELFKGKLILQPSWTMSYTFVNSFGDYTLNNGVKIDTESTHTIQLSPGLKVIGNLPKGWQPYLGVNMKWNLLGNTKVSANYIGLPETSMKPYIEYGLGLQKTVGERFTGFGQAMFRGGGRNGVAFTFGFRWALGGDNAKKAK